MNSQIMKNKTVLILLLTILIPGFLAGQNDLMEFQKRGETTNNKTTNDYMLVDHNGLLEGSYTVSYSLNEAGKIKVFFNNKLLEFEEALSDIIINQEAERIYLIGDQIDAHKPFDVNLRIYNLSGTLLSTINSIGHHPYCYAISNDGSFYLASNTSYSDAEQYQLKKIDESGSMKWTKSLPSLIPSSISISGNGKAIALNLVNADASFSSLYIYNSSGKLQREHKNLNSISGLQFKNDHLLVASGNDILFYDKAGDKKFTNKLTFIGTPIGKYPLTVDNDAKLVYLITAISNDSGLVQAYDIPSRTKLAETFISGNLYWENYRIIKSLGNNLIRIILRDKNIELKLNTL